MSKLLALLKWFPYVLAAVTAVESSIGSAPGATKKQLILNSITAAVKVGEQVPQSTINEISGVIDLVVGALNTSGLFTHAVASPAPKVTLPVG